MRLTAGIDVGSTYTKTIVADRDGRIVARALEPTGFRLPEVAGRTLDTALAVEHGAADVVIAIVASSIEPAPGASSPPRQVAAALQPSSR